MCGITGFYSPQQQDLTNILHNMVAALEHRGPDSGGIWLNRQAALGLGHRRLAIQDLSNHGYQPFHNEHATLVYNGEIYNSLELRQELQKQGWQFAGESDTEVLFFACQQWGVATTCEKIQGIFAFAYWQKQDNTLFLARDRIGVKPVYWYYKNQTLLFASELKSLLWHPQFKNNICQQALKLFFQYHYIPAPFSIYEHTYKLAPGHYLCMPLGKDPQTIAYWSFNEQQQIYRPHNNVSVAQLIDETEQTLIKAVQRQMVSDVPVGSFLSGGIDSSLVTAIMQQQSSIPVKTFTIGFKHKDFDESLHAKKIADHLKTEHYTEYLDVKTAQDIIYKLPQYYDEPFADSSQIPTIFLSSLTSKHVKVALSGDGGDELFAGYNRYIIGARLWSLIKLIPAKFKKPLAKLLEHNWLANGITLATLKRIPQVGHKLKTIKKLVEHSQTAEQFYHNLITFWQPQQVQQLLQINDYDAQSKPFNAWYQPISSSNFVQKMQISDSLTYLPDDILVKVDRASMHHGLEVRVPLLDELVISQSFVVPLHYKLKNGNGKWILQQILQRYVPNKLFNRPKMGFGIPLNEWLLSMRPFVSELLAPIKLANTNLLNPEVVNNLWQQIQQQSANYPQLLWSCIVLQLWAEQQHLPAKLSRPSVISTYYT